jgi:GNAT superfamily N-acetyltransferase
VAEKATIRFLDADDWQSFRRIRLEALRMEPSAFASTIEDWEPRPEEAWRKRLAQNPVLVAFRDGEPVGIMGLARERSSKMAHRAGIIMVYVHASERGSGLAARLLEAVIEHALVTGIRQLELAVSVENPSAIRFYARHGFSEIGRIPGAFREADKEVDELLMARRIAP